MIRCLTITILFWVLVLPGRTQDAQFSQFYSTSVYLNPGLAGLQPTFSINTNYKRSAPSADGAYLELMHASVLYPLERVTTVSRQSGGVGLTFIRERSGFEGIYENMEILATGAYVVSLDKRGKNQLSFGLQAGAVQNRINQNALQFGSQYNPFLGYDPTLPAEVVNASPDMYPVINFGVVFKLNDHPNPLLQEQNMIIGFSASNLNQPASGFIDEGAQEGQAVIYRLFGISKLEMGRTFYLHPAALIVQAQGTNQINGGLYLSKYVDSNLTLILRGGGMYRLNDSFILMAGLQYGKLRTAVSFDLNSDNFNSNEALLNSSFNNSYEISLGYDLNFNASTTRVTNPLF